MANSKMSDDLQYGENKHEDVSIISDPIIHYFLSSL